MTFETATVEAKIAELRKSDAALRAGLRLAVREAEPDPCDIARMREALIENQWRRWRLSGRAQCA